jgi:L,D-transpeptidase YcbB
MLLALAAAAASLSPLAAAPVAAQAFLPAHTTHIAAEIARSTPRELREFYAARANLPLWLGADGYPGPAADALLQLVQSSQFDGIDHRKLKPRDLARALERARSGKPGDLAKAELALSHTFASYVVAMRRAPRAEMIYESAAVTPAVPTFTAALAAAASARSLETHLAAIGWMHPLYAPMRAALLSPGLSEDQRGIVWSNLERLRALPADPGERYVLIDTAGARLWMYEGGKPVDSMKVVVGKVEDATPMMAGFIRQAVVNPYWNVPTDLARERVAANVLQQGLSYLRAGGYQVLSDWSDEARVIDPKTVDWQAVFDGAEQIRVRQLPGSNNFMGTVKFVFPNDHGIYLHDTPDKHLLAEAARQHSAGCIRLEDAQRLGRWLMGKPLPRNLKGPEQRIALPELVPVYITYLTARPENGRIVFSDDSYGRDRFGPGRRLATSRSR